jgi:hypothetical protein
MAVAEHGVVLVRSFLLTLAASTPEGIYRRELRPARPRSFAGIPWPPEAIPLLSAQLERSREEARKSLLWRLFKRRALNDPDYWTLPQEQRPS